MTNEEATKIIGEAEFLTHHDADYGISVYEAVCKAKEALEAVGKTDKYRWHDLRKNPEDLPKDFEEAIVYVVRDNDWYSMDFGWYKGGFWFTRNYCNGAIDRHFKVIAWREIEWLEEKE